MKRIFVVIFSILYLGIPVAKYKLDKSLHIWVLDVGQGDAILVRTPDDKTILVDVGPGNTVLSELGEVLPYWVRTINIIVLTHPHDDHIAAAKDVISRYEIDEIIWFKVEYSHPIYKWLDFIEKSGIARFSEYVAGQTVSFGAMDLHFLYPVSLEERRYENINNASVAFILEYKNFRGLFTGDAETEEEMEFEGLKGMTFLKAGHHCSNTSNSEGFLEAIDPEIAVCSVGANNKFGHPSVDTLMRFEEMGIEYYRTDLDGRIEIVTDGEDWFVDRQNI